MSFISGSINVTRAVTQDKLQQAGDDSWVDLLKSFQEKSIGSSKVYLGVFGNELSTDFTKENSIIGNFVVFSVLIKTIKISNKEVKMLVNHRLRDLVDNHGYANSRKVRKEITEEVREELLSETNPTTKIVQIIINPSDGLIYIGDKSNSTIDHIMLTLQTFLGKNIKIVEYANVLSRLKGSELLEKFMNNPLVIENKLQDSVLEYPLEDGLSYSFLTWLMIQAYSGESEWELGEGIIGLICENMISLDGYLADTGTTVLKKSFGQTEINSSLKTNKLVNKIKINMADTDSEFSWKLTLKASCFNISGMIMSKSTEKTRHERMLDRISKIETCFSVLDEIFLLFAEYRYGPDWDADEALSI